MGAGTSARTRIMHNLANQVHVKIEYYIEKNKKGLSCAKLTLIQPKTNWLNYYCCQLDINTLTLESNVFI